MKKIIIFLLIFIISLCLFMIFLLKPKGVSYVKINGRTFIVDIATTNEQKAKGLDIYNKLPIKKGMVFPFINPDYYPFWMKGMKFPIDIIYINENRIVDIYQDVPYPKTENETPVVIRPQTKANLVLEINAGLSRRYNFKKGDLVDLHL